MRVEVNAVSWPDNSKNIGTITYSDEYELFLLIEILKSIVFIYKGKK